MRYDMPKMNFTVDTHVLTILREASFATLINFTEGFAIELTRVGSDEDPWQGVRHAILCRTERVYGYREDIRPIEHSRLAPLLDTLRPGDEVDVYASLDLVDAHVRRNGGKTVSKLLLFHRDIDE